MPCGAQVASCKEIESFAVNELSDLKKIGSRNFLQFFPINMYYFVGYETLCEVICKCVQRMRGAIDTITSNRFRHIVLISINYVCYTYLDAYYKLIILALKQICNSKSDY